jgi:V8-like Glu-specific endopeptidase
MQDLIEYIARNITITAIVLGLLPRTAHADPSVLYGEDHRLDIFEAAHLPEAQEWARSTALVVHKQNLSLIGDRYVARSATYGPSFGLCSSERFFDQPLVGYCSSFLVNADTVVTAGHCVQNNFDCRNTAFVFDYGYQDGITRLNNFDGEQVYFCKTLVKNVLDARNGNDFSIIKLDRAVIGREPLRVRTSGEIADHAPLTVVGNPSGLPTKIASGAFVRSASAKNHFTANLDTFEGNSGSAVFHSETGLVEGILVRGEEDFVSDSTSGCRKSKRCADAECRGETVIRATEFAKYIVD